MSLKKFPFLNFLVLHEVTSCMYTDFVHVAVFVTQQQLRLV